MFEPDQYELVDFGSGRKLERLAGLLIDRPSPPAEHARRGDPAAWRLAGGRFELTSSQSGPERGKWTWLDRNRPDDEALVVRHAAFSLKLGFTPFGHVGLFPEQAANWDWITNQCRANRIERVLNLFAYTGGSTLAAATAGAQVTHVDAAKNSVQWARRNAARSGMEDAPIRWIVDDALKFTARELRRGRQYNGIVLDPPSYGHGTGGEAWRLERHLPELLSTCDRLLADTGFLLLTCHTPDWDADRLQSIVRQQFRDQRRMQFSGNEMTLTCRDGRHLPSGYYLRCRLG